MSLEHLLDHRWVQRSRMPGGRGCFENSPQPCQLMPSVAQTQQLRIVAIELTDDLVAERFRLCRQAVVCAAQLTKPDQSRLRKLDAAVELTVRHKRVRDHVGVQGVVLGSSRRISVSKAIELPRREGEHLSTLV